MFISAKLVTVIPLTYIPLYFLETLEMNKVNSIHYIFVLIVSSHVQTSIAVGPLVVFAVSCILTPFAKKVSKYVGIEVYIVVSIKHWLIELMSLIMIQFSIQILFIVGVVIVWISM